MGMTNPYEIIISACLWKKSYFAKTIYPCIMGVLYIYSIKCGKNKYI